MDKDKNTDKHGKDKPKRYFSELAELGILGNFLHSRMKNDFEKDYKFRDEMLEIIYSESKGVDTELELFYLKKINETFNSFLEEVKIWMIPKH